MPLVLTTDWFLANFKSRFENIAAGSWLQTITLPSDGSRLAAAQLDQVEVAFFHGDFRSDASYTRRFFGTTLNAPSLRWMHLPNSGVDDPVFARLLSRGVRLTTSPGAAAEPIAHSAVAGLLALARGFPYWIDAQRRHAWEDHPPARMPRDLRGQKLILLGVGAIGRQIGRLAQAFGLHVIGIRRSPRADFDPVDEMHPPSKLLDLLPQADWLVVTCPLTDATRGLIDCAALARLPRTAHVINVARGQIIEQLAMIAALQRGDLAGAYLDVFESEPLPADSPLWDLPNVLISPHDSGASTGNAFRASELFLENLTRWLRGEKLANELSRLA